MGDYGSYYLSISYLKSTSTAVKLTSTVTSTVRLLYVYCEFLAKEHTYVISIHLWYFSVYIPSFSSCCFPHRAPHYRPRPPPLPPASSHPPLPAAAAPTSPAISPPPPPPPLPPPSLIYPPHYASLLL